MPRFASGSLLSDSRKYILRVWPDTGGNEEEGGGRGLPPTPTSIPTFHAWETMQFHGFFISKVSRVSVVSRGRADTQSTLRYVLNLFRDSGIANEIPIPIPIDPPSPSDALKFYSTD